MASDPTETFSHPRVAAGVLFWDDQDRLLLVVPSYKDYRDIPGGYVETGETPTEAAIREVREELGITPPIGPLLVVDWAPNQAEGDKLLFVFDGGILSPGHVASIKVDPAEINSYEFRDVEDIENLTIVRLARRVIHGRAARRDGRIRYLEHGDPMN